MLKKKFEEIRNNPQNRMNAVILLVAVVVVVYAFLSYIFINGLSDNLLDRSTEQQDKLCKYIARNLDSLIEQEQNDDALIEYIEKYVDVQGDSWPFLIKGESVIFAKNLATTQSLKQKSKKSVFVSSIEEQEQIISMEEMSSEGEYVFGIITDRNRYSIKGDMLYFIMLMGSIVILAIAGIVFASGNWTKAEKRLIHVNEELRVRNEEFETYKNRNEEYYSTTSLKLEAGARSNRYKQYAFKFYINARHAIFIDGKRGTMHPHTWELHLNVMKISNDFVQFNEIEEEIRKLIMPFQDKEINSIEPFNVINPTLENCCNYFRDEIASILRDKGWLLLMIEMSETPSRSYVVNMIAEDT